MTSRTAFVSFLFVLSCGDSTLVDEDPTNPDDPTGLCDNGFQDGEEHGVDCGGACGACLGEDCASDADCAQKFCDAGKCAIPACDDGLQNGEETGIDCGGLCPACPEEPDAGPVQSDVDATDPDVPVDPDGGPVTREDAKLPDPTCSDGLKNQDESDVDCGGDTCDPCDNGETCTDPEDCAAGGCELGECCEPNACGECTVLPAEVCNGIDDDCDGATDEDLIGPDCDEQLGVCAGSVAACRGEDGWQCDYDALKDYSADYEPAELSCDDADNDCDGEADELIDCTLCELLPQSNTITQVQGTDTLVSWQSYALHDTEQFGVMSNPAAGPLRDLYLITATGHEIVLEDTPKGLPSVASDGESLYVASVEATDDGADAVVWRARPLPITEIHRVKTSPLVPTALVAARPGELALVYWDESNQNHSVSKRVDDVWTVETYPTTNPQLRLEYDADGELHGIWHSDKLWHVGPDTFQDLAAGGVKRFDIAADPFQGMHGTWGTVVGSTQTVSYAFWQPGGGWGEPIEVGAGGRTAIAVKGDGIPWVAWFGEGEDLHVSRIVKGEPEELGVVDIGLQKGVIPWWTFIGHRVGLTGQGALHIGGITLIFAEGSGSYWRFGWWCPSLSTP